MRLISILTLLLLLSCQSGNDEPLRIGAKPFAEQAILANMVRLLLAEEDIAAEVVDCESSFDCQRRLRDGHIDLMVEYTGTALQFVGGPQPDHDSPIDQVRELYEPLHMQWLDPLGFDNGYRILVPANLAATHSLDTIGDLERLEEGVRFASPPEFIRRSRDGLSALTRRYGLRINGEPLLVSEPPERYLAVTQGRADAAIGYSTDSSLSELGLVALDDPEQFFPPYQAAILVRDDALESRSGLRSRLEELSDHISEDAMRELNFAVQVEGQNPNIVALRFLRAENLVDSTPEGAARTARYIVIAQSRGNSLGREMTRATKAIRHLFPKRTVRHNDGVDDALDAVIEGEAHFAVVGADRFFETEDGDREERAEALAVLGVQLVHVVRRASSEPPRRPLAGRAGVQPEATLGGRLGRTILAANDIDVAESAPAERLLRRLANDELDVAVIAASQGTAAITNAFRRQDLTLVDISSWLTPRHAIDHPYFQRARIPAGTYRQQTDAVETLSFQIVLAGFAANQDSMAGAAGPAAALPQRLPPLTREQIEQISEIIGIPEVPDAVLPTAWTRASRTTSEDDTNISKMVLETFLNVFVIAFLVWIVLGVIKHNRRFREHQIEKD